MHTVTIELKHPVMHGTEEVTRLELLGPLRGKHLRGIPLENITFDHVLMIAGRMCGHVPTVMEQLQGDDLMRVIQETSGFLSGGRVTGS
jgi:hypothetical protein